LCGRLNARPGPELPAVFYDTAEEMNAAYRNKHARQRDEEVALVKLIDTMIAWQPIEEGQPRTPLVSCGPHPAPRPSWPSPYLCTDGACWKAWRQLTDLARLEPLFGLFGPRTVADKVPAEEAHSAFREIDEHRAVVQRSCDHRG
jgi:hypothetical protein